MEERTLGVECSAESLQKERYTHVTMERGRVFD